MDIFSQLLEMDDEEDREFSKSIVWNYFDQAESTFLKMDTALANTDLLELSTLGHFLKGSSAAVGVIKVRDSCECMQHYGKEHDEDGVSPLSTEEALKKITDTLRDVKVQYKEAEKALKGFYDEEYEEEEETEAAEPETAAAVEAEEEDAESAEAPAATADEAEEPASTPAAKEA
ncbi:histidine-phosphotransfer domain, HPT domain-containing protein [Testicularia cyperi]|uniref:Histidine-phosphotransfer domain, HPT domain-containing protein n=1 Tax=Testicularia cyperi TaxID=1882483 RepID=A0A317XVQ7_9BASI|nr:histidine-phosphotransfer domain, HPT domain-containing protein [Testicularia cyperi]